MSFRETLLKLSGKGYCCSCGCCEERGKKNFKEDKEFEFNLFLVIRLLLSCIILGAALIIDGIPKPWPLIMLIVSALVSGYDIIAAAAEAIMRNEYFDRCVLIFTACVLSFVVGLASEGAALILLFQIGGVFIDYAYMRTRSSVLDELSGEAQSAHILIDGIEDLVPADSINPGDSIIIYPGEHIPCDCVILSGGGNVDVSPHGGGKTPVFVSEGDEIFSGCINVNGTLRCEATASRADSAASLLNDCVRTAADDGSPVPRILERFLSLYTPTIIILAIMAAWIIPLIYKIGIIYAVRRAIVFLIIANPCAMFVAFPLIRFCTVGRAAKKGVLFKSLSIMEEAAHAGTVIFDKAGTLTTGSPRVASIKSGRLDTDTFLKIAAHVLAYSENTVAKSVIASYGGTIYIELLKDFKEIPNKGVEVYVDGVQIFAGNLEFMEEKSIVIPDEDVSDEMAVYVAIASKYAGRLQLVEGLRDDAASGVSDLNKQGIDVVMFTSEKAATSSKTSAELMIREYYSNLSSEQKLSTIEEIKNSLSDKAKLLFAGEAKSLGKEHTAADVDISICSIQALETNNTADILILNGKVSGVAAAIEAARYSESFSLITVFAVLAVKLTILALAFLGIATIWFAVFIDCAAAMGAILCSIRALSNEPPIGRQRRLLLHK